MSERGKCVRIEIEHEDGTTIVFAGDAADQHFEDLRDACMMARIHGWAPREPRKPPVVFARSPSPRSESEGAA